MLPFLCIRFDAVLGDLMGEFCLSAEVSCGLLSLNPSLRLILTMCRYPRGLLSFMPADGEGPFSSSFYRP